MNPSSISIRRPAPTTLLTLGIMVWTERIFDVWLGIGGLLVSQLLTLYITPVYYVYIERARQWVAAHRSADLDGVVASHGSIDRRARTTTDSNRAGSGPTGSPAWRRR